MLPEDGGKRNIAFVVSVMGIGMAGEFFEEGDVVVLEQEDSCGSGSVTSVHGREKLVGGWEDEKGEGAKTEHMVCSGCTGMFVSGVYVLADRLYIP